MSKLFYRKTDNFEFVEYPYRMDYVAVIYKDGMITYKPIQNADEADFLNLEYKHGNFVFENIKYKTSDCKLCNEIPEWFKTWSKENNRKELLLDYTGLTDFDVNTQKRDNYLSKIGLI